jgi:hypothetical protein
MKRQRGAGWWGAAVVSWRDAAIVCAAAGSVGDVHAVA